MGYRILTNVAYALAFPWLAWRRASGGREWAERLGDVRPRAAGGLWIHAASVGEVAAAAPLVRALRSGGEDVVLTVVTPTGREVAGRTAGEGVEVFFGPLDLAPCVGRAVAGVAPRALLLVETELWPNLIAGARAGGATVGVVNGRLSERSARRYRLPGSPIRGLGDAIAFVACQSDEDRDRFVRIGVPRERVTPVGNTKYDALPAPLPARERDELRDSLGIPADSPVVVFGSVRPLEEEAVAAAASGIASSYPDARMVVAPRHLDRLAPLEGRLRAAGLEFTRRTAVGAGAPPAGSGVLLDTTGELSNLYAIATVAFVGGSLGPYGGHNPLEPAAHGVPVLLGPSTESCAESAERLVSAGGAAVVRDGNELTAGILSLLADPGKREEAAARAIEAIEAGRGATGRTMALLRDAGVIET